MSVTLRLQPRLSLSGPRGRPTSWGPLGPPGMGRPEQGRPEIFSIDQGSQFTSDAFTGMLLEAGVRISMDGKGRYNDNIFVERLWRSIKYEEVYLKAYENGTEARAGIGAYLNFYNQERPHQALGYRALGAVFQEGQESRGGHTQEVALPSGDNAFPPVAADSLNLASLLS
jgi:transposase InsO family protein